MIRCLFCFSAMATVVRGTEQAYEILSQKSLFV